MTERNEVFTKDNEAQKRAVTPKRAWTGSTG